VEVDFLWREKRKNEREREKKLKLIVANSKQHLTRTFHFLFFLQAKQVDCCIVIIIVR
jgi:hypothetical protein